jgi:hypothetical protein
VKLDRMFNSAKPILTKVIGLVLALVGHPALAALGEPVESIERDAQRLVAVTHTVESLKTCDRHVMTMADGSYVREYVNDDGTVFAISWRGSVLPDLRILLGNHFDTYTSSIEQHRSGRHQVNVVSGRFVLHSMRLPRGFSGVAQLTDLLPAGSDAKDFN